MRLFCKRGPCPSSSLLGWAFDHGCPRASVRCRSTVVVFPPCLCRPPGRECPSSSLLLGPLPLLRSSLRCLRKPSPLLGPSCATAVSLVCGSCLSRGRLHGPSPQLGRALRRLRFHQITAFLGQLSLCGLPMRLPSCPRGPPRPRLASRRCACRRAARCRFRSAPQRNTCRTGNCAVECVCVCVCTARGFDFTSHGDGMFAIGSWGPSGTEKRNVGAVSVSTPVTEDPNPYPHHTG